MAGDVVDLAADAEASTVEVMVAVATIVVVILLVVAIVVDTEAEVGGTRLTERIYRSLSCHFILDGPVCKNSWTRQRTSQIYVGWITTENEMYDET